MKQTSAGVPLRGLVVIAAAVFVLGGHSATRALATGYDNTNPGATPCGDGSHPVTTWRYFYISRAGLIYARIDLRRSEYCNTVWTRAVNVTGSGSGFAPAQSITTDEEIWVYNCPKPACVVRLNDTETGDVLPVNGSTGWSLQLVLPAGGTQGSPAARQPPTVRGVVTVHLSGGTVFSFDTVLEPIWTAEDSQFDNSRLLRDGSRILSCDNSAGAKCISWGEPGGASASLLYYVDPNMSTLGALVDVKADIRDVLLPAWSHKTTRSPIMAYTTNPDSHHAQFVGDTTSYCGAGFTSLSSTSGTPALFLLVRVTVGKCSYSHYCGTLDDGCNTNGRDDRVVLSHEIGHTIGLGHCDLNYGVLCHTAASTSAEVAEGISYWNPQTREIAALKAIYP